MHPEWASNDNVWWELTSKIYMENNHACHLCPQRPNYIGLIHSVCHSVEWARERQRRDSMWSQEGWDNQWAVCRNIILFIWNKNTKKHKNTFDKEYDSLWNSQGFGGRQMNKWSYKCGPAHKVFTPGLNSVFAHDRQLSADLILTSSAEES